MLVLHRHITIVLYLSLAVAFVANPKYDFVANPTGLATKSYLRVKVPINKSLAF